MALVPESEAVSKMLFWCISAYTQSDSYVTCPVMTVDEGADFAGLSIC
jgi:hypothetical protein